jgi:hypothetical protein
METLMPEDAQPLRQKSPGPTCVAVNVFSGRVIAYATADSEEAAKLAAKELAQNKRDPLVQEDEARPCPGNCLLPGSSSAPELWGDALMNVWADAVTPIHVAYHWTGWRTTVDCASTPQYADLQPSIDAVPLQFTVDTVCPGRRTMSGCVLAMAIDRSQPVADDKARDKAKRVADAAITAQRQKTCPGNCARDLAGDVESTPVKLGPHHEILQARAGGQPDGEPRYVSYFAAPWHVEILCRQPHPVDDGGDDGEGEMYEPRRGERR